MVCWLALSLLSAGLVGFAKGSFQVLVNSSATVFLQYRDGALVTGYGFALQQNTLLAKVNFTVDGELVEPPAYGILPNVFVEVNDTIPLLKSTSVRGFLDFGSWSGDWGTGLLLEQRTPTVYEVSGSWYSPTAPHLNFRVRMFMASSSTSYDGFKLEPHEIFMIYKIIDFPFRFLNSKLALDQITLTGIELTNFTLPNYFVFTSGGLTSLYVNKTAIVDGRHQGITLSKSRLSNLWAKLEQKSTTVTRNLSGRNVDDFVLAFNNSNNARNVTVQQVLRADILKFSRQSTHERTSHAPQTQELNHFLWIFNACYLILSWLLVLH